MGGWDAMLLQASPAAAFLATLVYVARLIYTGKLVPRATVEDLRNNFAQQIDRERQISLDWQTAANTAIEAGATQGQQIDALLNSQRQIEAILIASGSRQRPTVTTVVTHPGRPV